MPGLGPGIHELRRTKRRDALCTWSNRLREPADSWMVGPSPTMTAERAVSSAAGQPKAGGQLRGLFLAASLGRSRRRRRAWFAVGPGVWYCWGAPAPHGLTIGWAGRGGREPIAGRRHPHPGRPLVAHRRPRLEPLGQALLALSPGGGRHGRGGLCLADARALAGRGAPVPLPAPGLPPPLGRRRLQDPVPERGADRALL